MTTVEAVATDQADSEDKSECELLNCEIYEIEMVND